MLAPSPLSNDSWPPDYFSVIKWRQQQLLKLRADPVMMAGAIEYYSTRPAEFICHWMDTYDPRNASAETPTYMPFILFDKQAEFLEFIMALIENGVDGLIEKCRDMGATWLACALSVWLWRFYDGAAVGWGSRKEQLVDKLGDPDSIFEKLRIIIRRLPPEFLPVGFSYRNDMGYMKITNPDSGATITGEAGDNIGRGGRKLIYLKDESAHYTHPESIEAALADNTNTQIDISSVNGLGNVFHTRRESGIEWYSGMPMEKGNTYVFIMAWEHHPAKTQEWYDARRNKAINDGLLSVFQQEVDRSYSAGVEGIIIPPEWVAASIDAHIKLGFEPVGKIIGGLDVADGGGDKDALTFMKGSVVFYNEARPNLNDTGATARWAVEMTSALGEDVEIEYDSVGIGAGVKSETNRLAALPDHDPQKLPDYLTFTNWSAGAGVLNPKEHIVEDDEQTPLNEDFYDNLKAQAWWELRLRFERTFRAINEGIQYHPDQLISLSSQIGPRQLGELRKELSQAVAKKSTKTLKLVVDKNPPGTNSPNRADSLVQASWPIPDDGSVAKMFLRSARR